MEKIGFATEFYTLWSVTTEAVYFTDSLDNHHRQNDKINYQYIKNISTKQLEKVLNEKVICNS